jgi:hypothetical protein
VGSFLIALVTLPQSVLSLLSVPLAPLLLQFVTFFVTPFLLAGLLGMVVEAQQGETDLGTLRRAGRTHYVPLLLGALVRVAIQFTFALVGVLVVLVGVVTVLGSGAAAGGANLDPALAVGPVGLVLVGVFLLLVVAYLVVVLFVQFFPVAIVAEDRDVVAAFRRSYRVVRANPLATLGYSLLSWLIGLVATLPLTGFSVVTALSRLQEQGGPGGFDPAQTGTGGASAAVDPGALGPSLFSPAEVAVLAAASLLLGTLILAIQQSYAVAFFTAVRA